MISTQKTRASIKKAWAALCSQLCCAKIFCVSDYLSILPSVPLINIVEAPIRWRNQIETSSRRGKLPNNELNFVMLNLFQHLTRLADIFDAGKTLKQVQGDSISALQSSGFFENEHHFPLHWESGFADGRRNLLLVRIARILSLQNQRFLNETIRAWSKSKTGQGETSSRRASFNGKLKVKNGKLLRNFSFPRPLRERVRVRGYLDHSYQSEKGGATCLA